MNKYNMSRNDNKYKYNYEEEVKDSEYLTINVNLKNKVVIAILVIMCISLVGLLIVQIGKYSNSGRSFNTGSCSMGNPGISEDQLVNIILSEQLPKA